MTTSRARRLHAALARVLGSDRFRLELWDGDVIQGARPPAFTMAVRSKSGLDVLVGGLPERAFGRAYATGQLEIEPLEPFLEVLGLASAWAVAVAATALRSKRFDCVMIGAGLRRPPERLHLFEKIINLVHVLAPEARICFNTTPADTVEAVRRWIEP